MSTLTLTIASITGVVLLGAILFVVFFEKFTFNKKQKKYDQLHKQMGLGEDSDHRDSTAK